jgi:esterase/lipase
MPDYSTLTTTIVQETKNREAALALLDEEYCHSIFLLYPEPRPKVFLFFHGFTATPAQFVPLGKTLYEAGYNVVVPLMPGHGLAGNWSKSSPPPLPEDPEVYKQVTQEWLARVQGLGDEVIVGGLSSGGTMTAWLAQEFPQQISRAMLFAPYLSGSNFAIDLFVRMYDGYFEWVPEPGTQHFGYDGFLMPSLEIVLKMGEEILERAKTKPAVPMLIISSASDNAVSDADHQALFKAVLKHHPHSWYHRFASKFNMPHTMMTRAEGNEFIDLLIAVIKAYVESDITWAEVEAIRQRITQGQSFDNAVAELNLSQRTTPDLIPLVTMA